MCWWCVAQLMHLGYILSFITALDCIAVWSLLAPRLSAKNHFPKKNKEKKEKWESSASVNCEVGVRDNIKGPSLL